MYLILKLDENKIPKKAIKKKRIKNIFAQLKVSEDVFTVVLLLTRTTLCHKNFLTLKNDKHNDKK